MSARTIPVWACLAAAPLASCHRSAVPPAPAPAPAAATTTPGCTIDSARDTRPDDGTELRVWNLTASGLKRLTARLLVATDGTVQTAHEVEYKWDGWGPDAPAAPGQLVLLLQDGAAFGAAGRLPLLGLDLRDSPPHVRAGRQQRVMLGGELRPRMTTAAQAGPVSGGRSVLYAQAFLPGPEADGTFSLGSDPESVVAASKGGRTVVAVTLEWAPQ